MLLPDDHSNSYQLSILFYTACNVGDEGGFAPNILDNKEGLELLKTAIANAGYTKEIEIGMDVAASEFCKDKKYDLDFKNPNSNPKDYVSNRLSFFLFFLFSKFDQIVSAS